MFSSGHQHSTAAAAITLSVLTCRAVTNRLLAGGRMSLTTSCYFANSVNAWLDKVYPSDGPLIGTYAPQSLVWLEEMICYAKKHAH